MITPLASLEVTAHQLGSELDIFWTLPTTLPTNYKVYIFQRSQTDVTQEEIDSYFAHIADLSAFVYNGLFVFDKIKNGQEGMGVYEVINGLVYYYKAVIRDETTGEYSATISANATPNADVLVEIYDGKEIVAKTLKKMLDGLKNATGKKIQVSRDIEVVKQFTMGEPRNDQFMVERVNGANYQNYWGNILSAHGQSIILGDMDTDVIRVTYITISGPDRRDLMTSICRGRKPFLKIMAKKLGATDCQVTIEGDYYNPAFHGANVVGVTMIFTLLIENKTKIDYTEINQHITDMKVV
jgi:hypothetical protein